MKSSDKPMQPTPLPRAAILCVGYRRRPFSINVTDNDLDSIVRLNTVAMHLGIEDYGDQGMRFCDPFLRSYVRFREPERSFHVRVYVAVCNSTHGFLRLDHPDTTRLIQIHDQEDPDELLARYLTLENDVTDSTNVVSRLAAAVGMDPQCWAHEDDDQIHMLAVLASGPRKSAGPRYYISSLSQVDLQYHFRTWQGMQRFNRSNIDPYVLHGTIEDRKFHADASVNSARRYELMRVLDAASTSDHPLASLPNFDRVAFTRTFCPQHQTPASKASPPLRPLQQLAHNAALRAMLHEDPPRYVDAVDCVMEAALYKGSNRVPVAQQVLCFVKFDCGKEDLDMFDMLYVSPRMLAELDTIATLGDATRPRLLVFVFLRPLPGRKGHIHPACLPASFPSIAIRTPIGKPFEAFRHE